MPPYRQVFLRLSHCVIACSVLLLGRLPAQSQVQVPLPSLQLDGTNSEVLGRYRLPHAFRFEAIIRVDNPGQWRHVVELGGLEYGMNAPLRIEVGDPGEWYVAMGDGESYVDLHSVAGSWAPGNAVTVAFELDNGVGRLYENGELLGELESPQNAIGLEGTLILGSHKNTERFVQGEIEPKPMTLDLVPVVNLLVGETTFDGASSRALGGFVLPSVFTVTAEVRVDRSDQWRHLIEIGGREHGMNAAFRLETGQAGEWYVAVSDGQSTTDVTGHGSWDSGDWVNVAVTYDNGSGRLFENGKLLGSFEGPSDLSGTSGTLLVGSHRGDSRFFEGELRNARLRAGIHVQEAPATGGIAPWGNFALWNDSQKRYIVAEENGNLRADRESIGGWETFGAVPRDGSSAVRFGQNVALISDHKRWLVARPEDNDARADGCDGPGDRETWQFVKADDPNSTDVVRCWDRVGLRTMTGKFLVAQDNGDARADRLGVGPWETFLIDCQPGSKQAPPTDMSQCTAREKCARGMWGECFTEVDSEGWDPGTGLTLRYGAFCGGGYPPDDSFWARRAIDDVDRGCMMHDVGAWQWSKTHCLELGTLGCSSNVNLYKYIESVSPSSEEEGRARNAILNSLRPVVAICQADLYPYYESSKFSGGNHYRPQGVSKDESGCR